MNGNDSNLNHWLIEVKIDSNLYSVNICETINNFGKHLESEYWWTHLMFGETIIHWRTDYDGFIQS